MTERLHLALSVALLLAAGRTVQLQLRILAWCVAEDQAFKQATLGEQIDLDVPW
jgi:hypothetical protein